MWNIFSKKRQASKVNLENFLVDVRSYGGYTNHLVTYNNYKEVSTDLTLKLPALCGYTEWLVRGNVEQGSVFLLSAEDVDNMKKSGYCEKCVTASAERSISS
jgi:hypothetical protein